MSGTTRARDTGRMKRRAASAWAAASLSLAGCSSSQGQDAPAPTARPGPAAASVALDCANGMGTRLGDEDLTPVLGVVALPSSPHAAALGTGRLEDPALPRLFAKSALLVRQGSSFSLHVARNSPSPVEFSWTQHGAEPSPTRSLVVRNCRGTTGSKWLAFVGGYYVNRASCVTLIVTTATNERTVRVGIGRPCAGQRPPHVPSHS
jgi:hypothetical protein